MKRTIVALLAMAAGIGSAAAADLGRRAEMPVKAPVYAPYYNWTGVYVGINGGGSWGQSNWSNAVLGSTGDFDLSGGVVGGTLGFNYQTGPAVFGIEADIDWSSIDGSTSVTCGVTPCSTSNNWLGTVRGRLGYAWDRVMPYVTGGLAFGDIRANVAGLPEASDTNAGWTVGGGVEFAITGPVTAKVEYLYVDLGDFSCPTTSCGGTVPTSVDFRTHLVRGGINVKFGPM